MKKIILTLIISTILLSPIGALAYDPSSVAEPGGNISNVSIVIQKILTPLWQIFVGLSVIMIIVAGFLFLTSGGSPEKVATARAAALWSIAGIVVAILAYSVPGIISILMAG